MYAVRSGEDGEDISMMFTSSGIQNTGKISRGKYIRPRDQPSTYSTPGGRTVSALSTLNLLEVQR